MTTPARALFVVLDGIDGCGKSTQAARLAARLGSETGRRVHHLREPGSTRVGEALRAILLGRDYAPTQSVERSPASCGRRRRTSTTAQGPSGAVVRSATWRPARSPTW